LTRAPACLAAALLAVLPGCGGGLRLGSGFDLADLPEAPLAIVYRTREESERRVELLQQARESRVKQRNTETYDASFFRLETAADAFGFGRSAEEKAADLLGRMAAVDVRSEAVQPFEFAFRGDRPLDLSPDHRRLLFASLRSSSVQLYEWDRESGEVHQMTSGPEEHSTGCYLPDGRLAISSQSSRAGDGQKRISRIFVTQPGGGLPKALTPGPEDLKPACSPDGRVIAYESRDPAGNPSIAVIPTDGSSAPRVAAAGRDPAFTPDGAFVVYSARTRKSWRLYQMHPDGQAKRPLGGGPRDEHDPRVSPDGRYVIYVYDDEGRQQLRVRTIDGRRDRPLIWNGDGITPVW
jgi:dipeptidyl aminopeptidase/acylaminoacyl peptidase